jgi:hypothetical protein
MVKRVADEPDVNSKISAAAPELRLPMIDMGPPRRCPDVKTLRVLRDSKAVAIDYLAITPGRDLTVPGTDSRPFHLHG